MDNKELAKQIEIARQALSNFSKIDFPEMMKTLAVHIQQIKSFLGPDGALGEFARMEIDRKRVEESGWLPHAILPFEIVRDYTNSVDNLSESISMYFRINWHEAKAYFEDRLQDLDIGSESKETFREALECHSKGCYRASIRLLFPQIEHEISSNFISDRDNKKATVRDFLKTIEKVPAGYALDSVSDFSLFTKLHDHMYSRVNDDNITRFQQDMVPNRHASLHGIIPYNKLQHSINTIIMADYIFRIVTNLKKAERESG